MRVEQSLGILAKVGSVIRDIRVIRGCHAGSLSKGGFSKDSQTFFVTSGRISGCTSVTVTTQTTIQPQQRKEIKSVSPRAEAEKVTHFVMEVAKASRRFDTFETTYRPRRLFNAAMVLLQMVIQVAVAAMANFLPQLSLQSLTRSPKPRLPFRMRPLRY